MAHDITTGLEEYGMSKVYSHDDVKNCAKCFNKLASLLQKSKL